ncbi:ras GTPase-activating-like protein IQGAP1 isoform X2 [Gigantopelta aegis]|uniref:ras GTPase-activating-like protein IQGAP1 isoform X2 n=1 Tax=Gigantopelta aegis TaxID=1735272 RepID=UPI001B888834|nr:ras GTPase-activating-like protein IQGAP1 isoform X2 [Gigantopelta aegis]
MGDTDVSDGPKPHYRTLDDSRLSADEMDEQRKSNIAYEYLCHLEEAKMWIQACINEELPPSTELEEGLRNGVYLAKLGYFFAPQVVSLKRIYDREQTRFKAKGLHFRHTDNVNHWFAAMEHVGLPRIFYPETTDIYDRKNMPRAVYCVHALSLYLFKLGLAPQIQDLYGKINFTEEEISAMRKELEKYGIQMPTFSKIGGILANEMTVDEAALHAAIIAINEAIEKQVSKETFMALQNPAACLVNLVAEEEGDYQAMLYDAKQAKTENARNRSMDNELQYEHDVYDELLTQAEIQGNVNKVNTNTALDKVLAALLKMDPSLLLAALKSPHLGLKNVVDANIDFYIQKMQEMREIKKNNNNGEEVVLDKDDLQEAVNQANLEADSEYQKTKAVAAINAAIDNGDSVQLMRSLQNPASQLPPVCDFAAVLYLEEFQSIRADKQADLDHEELVASLKVLNAVAAINEAVDTVNPLNVHSALCLPDAHIADLDEQNMEKYYELLANTKNAKHEQACDLLTHHEISKCVQDVHTQVQEEHERILAIGVINEAINKGDETETLKALQLPMARLRDVDEKQGYHYQVLLAKEKDRKAEASNDLEAVLWLEEIQRTVQKANADAEAGLKLSASVQAINSAIDADDPEALSHGLSNSDTGLHSYTPDCVPSYMENLKQLKRDKAESGECGSGWMMNRLKDGSKFFFNIHTGEYLWSRQDGVIKDHALLTKEEIQNSLSEVTAAYDRELLFKSNEGNIIKGQALIRGYLQRKAYKERQMFIKTQLPAIVKIQACWRGYKQRKQFKDRLDYLNSNEKAAIKLQSYFRMWRDRKKYRDRLRFYKQNEDSIIKIQALFRSNLAQQDYKALMMDENPSLSVVRKFVHLLDASDNDYAEELELQKLRQNVVTEIRSNQQLEQDLDQMDIKIGLLIKNRITLQDVVTHNKKLTKRSDTSGNLRGLKALSKESHERLHHYQHLFYLLQTNPTYLAKLIFEMPQSKTTKFMESVIYSLFNYGANQREEYLLLKLFKTALEEEIAFLFSDNTSKVDKMTDIVTGNPLVVKMIVGFNRNQRGQNALREMLNPLITRVIEDRNLRINTNPVEVYKMWVNQTESQSGKTSGLPYDVSTEQALKHEEVVAQISESIKRLQDITDLFLTAILGSLDKIPYGMRYMAKVMKEALFRQFPDSPEKDILKIVGNLLYYRYINSAIVAPDAFDIISVGAEKALSNDQRRNLGSIAKILQFAASNKGFGGESSYLSSMNDYIRVSHEKFKKYCLQACAVEEPEVKFNVDQYSEVTMITKPVIYISVQEVVNTHQLLLQHQDVIAPDHNDPLHELLEDLGEVPTIDDLLGTELTKDEDLNENLRVMLAKTEISITLSSKFDVQQDDHADMKTLMIRTKRMIVDVIACQSGDDLIQVLDLPSSDNQEELHQAIVKKRDLVNRKATEKKGSNLVRHESILGDTRLPIESMKAKIKKNLQMLELAGLVSKKTKYQEIVNSIVQDIRNQRRYRNNRKQELVRLRATYKSLEEKRTFYESQIDYYNLYVKTCIDNLQHKSKKQKRHSLFRSKEDKPKTTGSITYSAARLHEKGIVLEIEGLPSNQFKNVLFEIAQTENPGVFEVSAKFMGVSMDKVELVFQDLLQLQYEGVAVMKMFNKAKINVNLLIFLLNRKFYGRNRGK